MLSIKNDTFNSFSLIVEMMAEGKHLTRQGIKKIIKLAYKMNVGGKYRKRNQKDLFKLLQSSETTR